MRIIGIPRTVSSLRGVKDDARALRIAAASNALFVGQPTWPPPRQLLAFTMETERFQAAAAGRCPRWREVLLGITLAGLGASGGWLLGFWTLVLRARSRRGEWPSGWSWNPVSETPRPSPLDPKELGWHYDLVWLLTFGAIFLIPATLLLSAPGLVPPPRRYARGVWMLSVLLALACLATIGLDNGGLFNWFLD